MSTDQVSLFLALLAVIAELATLGLIVVAVARRVAPAAAWPQAALDGIRPLALPLAAAIAITCVLGSLYFSEVADFPPCRLCWYQRIAMYPLALILPIAAWRRDVAVRWYAIPLAVLGGCRLDLPRRRRAVPVARDRVRRLQPVLDHLGRAVRLPDDPGHGPLGLRRHRRPPPRSPGAVMSSQAPRSSTPSKGGPTPKRPSGKGTGNRPAPRGGARPGRPASSGGATPPGGNGNRTLVIAGVVAVLVVVALVVALLAGGGDSNDETATGGDTPVTTGDGSGGDSAANGSVTVEGDPLTQHERGGDIEDDPAIGETLPTISGTDLDGQPVSISPDGAKLIVVMAHWCPHCQAEIPRIVEWEAGGGLPDGMELVGIATANAENRPNYPAKDWLEREGWTAPTMLDDDTQAARSPSARRPTRSWW